MFPPQVTSLPKISRKKKFHPVNCLFFAPLHQPKVKKSERAKERKVKSLEGGKKSQRERKEDKNFRGLRFQAKPGQCVEYWWNRLEIILDGRNY